MCLEASFRSSGARIHFSLAVAINILLLRSLKAFGCGSGHDVPVW